MSQNDLVISNQTFPLTRSDINSALQALGSTSSGPTAPTTTYANMMWYDTTTHILKIRAEANDAWISVGYLDQSSDEFKILDDTIVATTAGVPAGLLGDQTTATWEAGTGITESLVSPAKIKASIDANVEGITHTSGSAPYYGVRAWGYVGGDVKVDGGNFGSWNGSTNTVTFTTAMPHANYAVALNGQSYGNTFARSKTVNGFEVLSVSSGGNLINPTNFEFTVTC